MKKIGTSRIVVAVGLGVFAVATWFASRPPAAPSLLSSTGAATSTDNAAPSPIPAVVTAATPAPTHPIVAMSIVDPTSSAKWVIGSQNTISWNKPAGVTGQMYLVSATSGVAVGWIQQNIAPGQTYFPWNTRDLSLSETNPQGKNVVPGQYFIKIKFSSPSVPSVMSAVFSIVATTTP